MNDIRTWAQGRFVDQRKYADMSPEWKADQDKREAHLVRPSPTGNAICHTQRPDDAEWIASRLNLASILEQMTYDYATGKTDGSEIVKYVRENVT